MNRDVLSSAAISYLPRIIGFVTGAISFVVITKRFTTEQLGALQLIRTTCFVCVYVCTLGLQRYMVYAVPGVNRPRAYRTLSTVLLGELAMYAACVTLILYPLSGWLAGTLNFPLSSAWLWVAPALWLIYIFESRLLLFFGLLRRIKLKAILYSAEQLLYAGGLLVLFFVGPTIPRVIAFQLGAYLMILIVAFRFLERRPMMAGQPSWSLFTEGLRYSIPLILLDAGSRIIATSDRFMIAHFRNTAEVGLYGYAYGYIELAYLVGSPLLWSLYAYFADAYKRRQPERETLFGLQLKATLTICGFVSLGLLAHRGLLVPFLSRPDYLEAGWTYIVLAIFPIVMVTMFTFQQILLLERDTRFIGLNYLLAAVINIGLNWLLIPHFGHGGAAIGTVVTYTLLMVLTLWRCRGRIDSAHYRWLAWYVVALGIWAGLLYVGGIVGRQAPWAYLVISVLLALPLAHVLRLLDLRDIWRMARTRG